MEFKSQGDDITLSIVNTNECIELLLGNDTNSLKEARVTLQNITVLHKKEEAKSLSSSFTGDISLMQAITNIVESAFCPLKLSASCSQIYKKRKTTTTKLGCPICLGYQRNKSSEKKKIQRKSQEDMLDKLCSTNSNLKEHIVHQLERKSANQKYNAR